MANRVIKGTLDQKGIAKIRAELQAYKNTLNSKNEQFVRMLSNEGLTVAKTVAGLANDHFTKQITFGMVPRQSIKGVEYIVYATAPEEIVKWIGDSEGNTHQANVSPVLMAEFGSGFYAIEGTTAGGQVIGGQGTLNTYGHAFDTNGWWFCIGYDGNGKPIWRHSKGTKPSRPMKQAQDSMVAIVRQCAEAVFGS